MSSFLKENGNMTHNSATLDNSLFSPLPNYDIQLCEILEKWKNQMGTHCIVVKLKLKSNPFVVPKWRKDESDLYIPSLVTRKKD